MWDFLAAFTVTVCTSIYCTVTEVFKNAERSSAKCSLFSIYPTLDYTLYRSTTIYTGIRSAREVVLIERSLHKSVSGCKTLYELVYMIRAENTGNYFVTICHLSWGFDQRLFVCTVHVAVYSTTFCEYVCLAHDLPMTNRPV